MSNSTAGSLHWCDGQKSSLSWVAHILHSNPYMSSQEKTSAINAYWIGYGFNPENQHLHGISLQSPDCVDRHYWIFHGQPWWSEKPAHTKANTNSSGWKSMIMRYIPCPWSGSSLLASPVAGWELYCSDPYQQKSGIHIINHSICRCRDSFGIRPIWWNALVEILGLGAWECIRSGNTCPI